LSPRPRVQRRGAPVYVQDPGSSAAYSPTDTRSRGPNRIRGVFARATVQARFRGP